MEEVDVHAHGGVVAEGRPIPQKESPAAVLPRRPLHLISGAPRHLLDRRFDVRTLTLHRSTVNLADVVEIEVHRQAGRRSEAKVQRGAACEEEAVLELRVLSYCVEKVGQPQNCLELARSEAGITLKRQERLAARSYHCCPPPSPDDARCAGTSTFHRVTRRAPRVRRPRYSGWRGT